MAYRIGRQKEGNKGLLRGNVIRTQLNNIMSYKCAKYRAVTYFLYCLSILYTNFLTNNVFITCSISSFLHEHNKFRVFEIRPLVVLHSLGGVYCVEEGGGGVSPGWNGKKGEGDPYIEV